MANLEPMVLIESNSSENLSVTKKHKMMNKRIIAFGFLVMMIPILVTIIATVTINEKLKNTSTTTRDRFDNIQQDLNQLLFLNGSYESIKLEISISMSLNSTHFYEQSGNFDFLAAKTKDKMNFTEGKKVCEMVNGYMLLLWEKNEVFKSNNKILAEKFDVDEFYLDIQKEGNVWKWGKWEQVPESLRILSHTKHSIWNEGEPSNHPSENCAQVQRSVDGKSYGLNNVDCSTKSYIICFKKNSEEILSKLHFILRTFTL